MTTRWTAPQYSDWLSNPRIVRWIRPADHDIAKGPTKARTAGNQARRRLCRMLTKATPTRAHKVVASLALTKESRSPMKPTLPKTVATQRFLRATRGALADATTTRAFTQKIRTRAQVAGAWGTLLFDVPVSTIQL